jgi:hypothetical protein
MKPDRRQNEKKHGSEDNNPALGWFSLHYTTTPCDVYHAALAWQNGLQGTESACESGNPVVLILVPRNAYTDKYIFKPL